MTTKPPVEKPGPDRSGETPSQRAAEATHVELGQASLQQIYAELLHRIGEDPSRNGLARTPERMEKAITFLTRGYGQTVEQVEKDSDRDRWFTADEAKEYGFIDHVVRNADEVSANGVGS